MAGDFSCTRLDEGMYHASGGERIEACSRRSPVVFMGVHVLSTHLATIEPTMRVGICAGHSTHPQHRGVTYGDLVEQHLCRAACDVVESRLLDAGVEVFDPRIDELGLPYPDYINQRIDVFNQEGVDAAVDLHLNDILPGQSTETCCNGSCRTRPRIMKTERM